MVKLVTPLFKRHRLINKGQFFLQSKKSFKNRLSELLLVCDFSSKVSDIKPSCLNYAFTPLIISFLGLNLFCNEFGFRSLSLSQTDLSLFKKFSFEGERLTLSHLLLLVLRS